MSKIKFNRIVLMGIIVFNFIIGSAFAENEWFYDPSPLYPFGAANPAQTDPEARIFDTMIGVHNCTQQRTNYATRETVEANGIWAWYYDMNGYGIRDHYRFGAGAPASQRVYNPETKQWHVWYFLGQGFYYAGEWVGGREGDRLVFKKHNEKQGDRLVLSQLEYFDITETSFKWKSSNIDNLTGEVFVDWSIECKKQI